ncbi:divalent-cation tolerance protein CutA [Alteromonas aestuariivivens]|uniref:Divalent-cation tolerance protein CutA n=1 Tax=Alteromonas aestuariivivens TaxID=1938339 RepID=A0A3D8M6W3_9ALTE|nr:divalent-cation tolerance protein CutA [Alteromonas aestuariivivens]RDV24902.1 divalent-cation tolerance protein CutA [Alteromonas aestuariivivens]
MAVSLIFCTVPNQEVGRLIANQLVEQRAAACVKIVPGVTSVYRWQGKVEVDQECQLLIKTTAGKVAMAYQLMVQMHPYEEPEWLVLDNASGSKGYLEWITNQTMKPTK